MSASWAEGSRHTHPHVQTGLRWLPPGGPAAGIAVEGRARSCDAANDPAPRCIGGSSFGSRTVSLEAGSGPDCCQTREGHLEAGPLLRSGCEWRPRVIRTPGLRLGNMWSDVPSRAFTHGTVPFRVRPLRLRARPCSALRWQIVSRTDTPADVPGQLPTAQERVEGQNLHTTPTAHPDPEGGLAPA